MRLSLLCAALVLTTIGATASEVDPLPQDQVQTRRSVPRGYIPPPPPRYYEPAPRYYEPTSRVRLGDTCAIYDSGRTCDLRRPAPVGSFCECVSPSGRVREGRVTR